MFLKINKKADLIIKGFLREVFKNNYLIDPIAKIIRKYFVLNVIAAAKNHTIIFQNKALWGWGYNLHGQLLGKSSKLLPKNLSTFSKIKNIEISNSCAGDGHTLLLTARGNKILGFGDNSYYQISNSELSSVSEPIVITIPVANYTKIIDIQAGRFHSLALTNHGKIFGWGYNKYFQINDDYQCNKVYQPTMVSALNDKTIILIRAGFHFSFALSDNREVIGWGYNGDGQINGVIKNDALPKKTLISIPGNKRIVDLQLGKNHVIALTDAGEILGWGGNWNGQINGSIGSKIVCKPSLLPINNILNISVGSHHNLALDSSGQVLAWGSNGKNQINASSEKKIFPPYRVDLSKKEAIKILAGMNHNCIFTSGGDILTWGANSYCQTGFHEDILVVKKPTLLQVGFFSKKTICANNVSNGKILSSNTECNIL